MELVTAEGENGPATVCMGKVHKGIPSMLAAEPELIWEEYRPIVEPTGRGAGYKTNDATAAGYGAGAGRLSYGVANLDTIIFGAGGGAAGSRIDHSDDYAEYPCGAGGNGGVYRVDGLSTLGCTPCFREIPAVNGRSSQIKAIRRRLIDLHTF